MNRIRVFFAITGVILALGCMALAQTKTYEGWGFTIQIDPQIQVSKKSPVEDFELYTFMYDGREILHAYAGNHPSFGKEAPQSAKEARSALRNLQVRRLDWRDTSQSECAEVLMSFGADHLPAYLHYSYSGLSASDARIANQIISSTR